MLMTDLSSYLSVLCFAERFIKLLYQNLNAAVVGVHIRAICATRTLTARMKLTVYLVSHLMVTLLNASSRNSHESAHHLD